MSDTEGEKLLKDLNLVPKSYFNKRRKRRKIVFYSIFSVIVIVILVVITLIPLLKVRDLKSKLADLELKSKEIRGYLDVEEEFNTLKSLYLQRENEAVRLLGSNLDVLNIIEKLESYLPDKIFIQNMNVNKVQSGRAEISIRGIAKSEEEIAAFYNYVSNDKFFSSMYISAINNMQTSGQKSSEKDSGVEKKEGNSYYAFDAVIYLTSGK
jgi:Tfp pilus assembly protein PilN